MQVRSPAGCALRQDAPRMVRGAAPALSVGGRRSFSYEWGLMMQAMRAEMFAEDARQVWVFVMLDAADIRAIRDHFTPRVELRIENERDEISVLLLTEEAGRLLGNVAGLRRRPG